jgi:hypothetical protein
MRGIVSLLLFNYLKSSLVCILSRFDIARLDVCYYIFFYIASANFYFILSTSAAASVSPTDLRIEQASETQMLFLNEY